MKLKDKRRKSPSAAGATSCEYCQNPERYNLAPAREENFVHWHYERIAYCRDAPRMRVRCHKSIPGSK